LQARHFHIFGLNQVQPIGLTALMDNRPHRTPPSACESRQKQSVDKRFIMMTWASCRR
jgi:hypothetical protein